MTKIKVFRFMVSNWASGATDDDKSGAYYNRAIREIKTESDIETEINAFTKNKNVVNILVNNVDVKYHNNARGNTIDLIYTIIYEDEPKKKGA